MNYQSLVSEIKKKKSFLCVGLDTDITKIPKFLLDFDDPIFEFNKRIIDATKDLCVAYKPNIAFYESRGAEGWNSLEKTINYIPQNIFTIADAKRGDIGNTSKMYAKTFFETYNFDSITINPYMGEDSVTPFLEFPNKWVIILAVTSNRGSQDFQMMEENGEKLYEKVLTTSAKWGNHENMMFVTGATHPEKLASIRKLAPKNFFLVPGVGAQGGDLHAVARHSLTEDYGILINSSRGIIYASQDENFAEIARIKAKALVDEMKQYFES